MREYRGFVAYSGEKKRRMAVIGRRIAAARYAAGLSQQGLADKLSFVRFSGTITKWEAGATLPHATRLPEVADALGVPTDHLVRGL